MDPLNPASPPPFQPPARLVVSRSLWQAMHTHVAALAPQEACGLLGGRGDRAHLARPVTNALHSPVRFRMEPAEQLEVMLAFEAAGLDLVAIYHSHPSGPPAPSPTDTTEAYYPEAAYLIWAPSGGRWDCRAFTIRDRREIAEISLVVEND